MEVAVAGNQLLCGVEYQLRPLKKRSGIRGYVLNKSKAASRKPCSVTTSQLFAPLPLSEIPCGMRLQRKQERLQRRNPKRLSQFQLHPPHRPSEVAVGSFRPHPKCNT